MGNEKLVSIVLPVFNGAEYISASIESVINQSYQNWELIIVNDCSTDNTLQIAEDYAGKDARIRVVSNEKNLKLPLTLNAGFSHAKGTYLTWTSDDNLYKPEAIRRLVEELEKTPGLNMVYSDYTLIDAEGNVLGEIHTFEEPQSLALSNNCGASFLYTAEAARQIGGYDADLFLAEDYDYWIRIYKNGPIKHISDNLYLYRQHSGSLSETKKGLIRGQVYKTMEKNFLFLYGLTRENGKQYRFFDSMLAVAPVENYAAAKTMLLRVDAGYAFHLRLQPLKQRLRKTRCWAALRKVKRSLEK